MKKILLFSIKFYKKNISPFLSFLGIHCKYYPSCSDYMKEAIIEYGCVRGIIKGIIRLLKCNPFSKGGYDPLK